MSDAPKRIWAWEFNPEEQNEWLRGGWDIEPVRNTKEYTLKDIADELAEQLQQIADMGHDCPSTLEHLTELEWKWRRANFMQQIARAALAKYTGTET